MSEIERSSWRDESYSTWHRRIDASLACTNIDGLQSVQGFTDSLWLEIDYSMPVFLLEVKYRTYPFNFLTVKDNTFSIRAQTNLANQANLPCLIVLHDEPLENFAVKLLNRLAIDKVKSFSHSPDKINHNWFELDEYDYVRFLFLMRNKKASEKQLSEYYRKNSRNDVQGELAMRSQFDTRIVKK